MKNTLLYFTLILGLFSSCSKKSYTALYKEGSTLTANETQYHLSKNLLKLEVIYTLNEPRVSINGIDQALTSSSTKVTIEDPIKITKLLVADQSQTFVVTGKQLSETSFVNTGINGKNSIQKQTISIPSSEIMARNTLPVASLTDSNIEAEAYSAILEMNDKLDKITTKDEAELALNLISFYKSQFKMLNEDFKPYVKKSKIKYTVIIDPTALYSEENRWSNTKDDKIYHTIYPKHIFESKGVLKDILTLEIPKPEASLASQLEIEEGIEGVVYRSPSTVNFTLSLKDVFVASDSLALAQSGTVKTISIKDLENNEGVAIQLFKSKNLENTQEFQEKIEPLDFDYNDTIESSQEVIKSEYKEKLKHIDLLINKLQERQAEL
ncbi:MULTISPECIES: hypothetical protein [Winogradskyella]|uniref:hypothetical protein n=1 Tax=Winogradskyella TaxID=286104 RepID=UPI0015CC2270|nr:MULTISPECIES: hypothetical protein [Winogradskyella]QXP78485.1 hypothetical protein H0I32_14885 [Winogradskyella sp. HaHa_3_26]